MKFNFFLIILNILNIHSTFANSCSSGYYYNGNSCVACPGGHYCPIGDQPKKCPKGTISHQFVSDRTKCVFCSTGYYNDMEGQIECKVCPQGHFCPTTDKHVPCPVGFVNQEFVSDRTTCFRCKEGYYNDEIGQYQCKKCPDGHFCPTSDTVFPCPVGTRSNEYVSDRTQCIQCSSGYYADEEGLPSCKACPEGHYCPTPDIVLPCPPGTVSNYFVSDRISCSRCKAGYYNDQPGLTTCKACPEGHYCPTSDIVLPCPPGTASNYYVSDRTLCSSCKSGYYNPFEGQTSCLSCPSGSKTDGISCIFANSTFSSCPVGSFLKYGLCEPCPVGFSCAYNQNTPKSCPAGTVNYYEYRHRASCILCSKGTYNNKPNGIRDDSYSDCRYCPNGHFCDQQSETPKKCPAGFVNYYEWYLRISCRKCSPGFYSNKIGGMNDDLYNDCKICPVGHYCPTTSGDPIKCPAGTTNYILSSHRTSCRKCRIGSYNVKVGGVLEKNYSDCKTCPSGYYCPSVDECPRPCPSGTTSSSGSWSAENCVPCTQCNSFAYDC